MKLMKLDIQKFASGTISGGYYNNNTQIYTYYMTWSSTSNGSSANTSNVTLNWIYKKNKSDQWNAYNISGSSKVTLVINGSSSGAMRADFDLRNASVGSTQVIASYTVYNVPHNADGTCTINVSGTHVTGTDWGTKSIGSTAITLDRIPRYANITSFSVSQRDETSVTYNWSADATCDYAWYSLDGSNWYDLPNSNVVSGLNPGTNYAFYLRVRRADSQLTSIAGPAYQMTYYIPHVTNCTSATIGQPFTIYIYNPLGRTYTLQLISTNNNQVIGSYTGSSTTDVIGFNAQSDINAMYASIPNAQQGQYRIKLTCGSWVHEWDSRGYGNYYINTDDCRPTFSNFTFEDINATTVALTGDNQKIINGFSNVKAIITTANKMTANNYASPSKYRLAIGSKTTEVNYSSDSTVNLTINEVSGGTITVSAIDSRNVDKAVTKTATAINKNLPTITANATRRNGVGTIVDLEIYGTYHNINFGSLDNEITRVEYSLDNGSNWSDISDKITYSNGSFRTISGSNLTGFTVGTSYNIIFRVSDGNNNNGGSKYILSTVTTPKIVISSGEPLLDINKSKKGVGVGKITDKKGLDVEGEIYRKGTNIIDIIYPVGSIYLSTNDTSPATLFGVGTWERMSGGFLYGTTGNSASTGNGTGTNTNDYTGNTGSHTLTWNEMPSHTHDRGTMEISGSFRTRPMSSGTNIAEAVGGAFGYTADGGGANWWAGLNYTDFSTAQPTDLIDFYASRNWIGNTGNAGAGWGHDHTMTHSHAIPYMKVIVWKRTA